MKDLQAERAWEFFAPQCLKWAPNGQELLRRWYRHRFTNFVRKQFSLMKVDPPRPLGSEQMFFKHFPYLKDKWDREKAGLAVMEPSPSLLLDRWYKQRRHEYIKNWLKFNRTGDNYNIKNQKYFYAFRNMLCSVRPRLKWWFFWFNNISLIVGLIFVAILLKKTTFRLFQWNCVLIWFFRQYFICDQSLWKLFY